MVTHLCRLVPCEKLDDGTLTVCFVDLESNLKLTLKLNANHPILQQINEMGLIVLECYWKNGRGIYSELPEVLVASRQMENKKIKFELFAILLALGAVALSLLLTWRT